MVRLGGVWPARRDEAGVMTQNEADHRLDSGLQLAGPPRQPDTSRPDLQAMRVAGRFLMNTGDRADAWMKAKQAQACGGSAG